MLGITVPVAAAAAASTAGRPSLEDLAFYYGTDKGHDDHKYTDLYHALFEPIRDRVANLTEVGIALGQSLQVWHDYFEHAHVWGVDIHPKVISRARRMFAEKPRVHILHANSKSEEQVKQLALTPLSMDIIIDDGDHYPPVMEKTLHRWWPYLRPGGYYCIEDVATGANSKGQRYGGRKGAFFFPEGSAPLVHNETYVSEETTRAQLGDERSPARAYAVLRRLPLISTDCLAHQASSTRTISSSSTRTWATARTTPYGRRSACG